MTDFIIQVKKMREAQKAYFKARRQNLPEAAIILQTSKNLEAIVDKMLKDMEPAPEPIVNLFNQP
jgi:galactokinase